MAPHLSTPVLISSVIGKAGIGTLVLTYFRHSRRFSRFVSGLWPMKYGTQCAVILFLIRCDRHFRRNGGFAMAGFNWNERITLKFLAQSSGRMTADEHIDRLADRFMARTGTINASIIGNILQIDSRDWIEDEELWELDSDEIIASVTRELTSRTWYGRNRLFGE
jgi:hypothetical protein